MEKFKVGDHVRICGGRKYYGHQGMITKHYVMYGYDYYKVQLKDRIIIRIEEEKLELAEEKDMFKQNAEEPTRINKATDFVDKVFQRIDNYIDDKYQEKKDKLLEQDENWMEVQHLIAQIEAIYNQYNADEKLPKSPYTFKQFVSQDTLKVIQRFSLRHKHLQERLYSKHSLICAAVNIEENMKCENVFKMLAGYGLTGLNGVLLLITDDVVCKLLELPEGETLF